MPEKIMPIFILFFCTAVFAQGRTSSFTDPRDRQTYRTVVMPDGKTWMAENLNYDTADGTGSWCFKDSPDSCAKYGRLYDWNTAMIACPVGWRLPKHADWSTLVEVAGGYDRAGVTLRSKTGWDFDNVSLHIVFGTDDFGFAALPTGMRRLGTGRIFWEPRNAHWWIAKDNADNALVMNVFYNRRGVRYIGFEKTRGLSVRCVRDD